MLSGCAINASFPDSSAVGLETGSTPLGSFSGSEYGGHAPIVGAHVFVLQATAGASYGLKATSLLQSDPSGTTAGGTATNVEVTNALTTGYGTAGLNYVTTDMYGNFNISGEYTCSPGLPVYLYATGGTSEVLPNSPISSGTVNSVSTTTGSVTFASNNLLSVGQQVNFSTISTTGTNGATLSAALDNAANVYTVTAATTNSFTVTGNVPVSAPITGGTVLLAAASVNNPAIGQMAVLGLCPSGTGAATNFAALNYVYMNEVSTVAAAYALGGFMTDAVTGPLHSVNATYLSIPFEGGNPLTANTINSITPPTVAAAKLSAAWVGLQNATLNAAQIYNIQGAGAVSSTSNGEGHVANATTPSGGTVSQALVNSIANSLAACVDSGHVAGSTNDTCTKLLGYALPTASGAGGNSVTQTSNSPTLSGTAPLETATAAINFAHNPWNPDVTNIINLPNQTAPYSPIVRSAQDLAVTITYPMTSAQSGKDGSVAIDQIGNAWVTSWTADALTELSPQGAVLNQDTSLPTTPGMVALDSTGAAWVALRDTSGFADTLEGAYKYSSAFQRTGPFGYAQSYTDPTKIAATQGLFDNIWVTVDNGDNAWFTNHVFNNTLVLLSSGTLSTSYSSGTNPSPGNANKSSSTFDGPFANAFDGSSVLWMTVNNGQFNNVTRYTSNGTTAATTLGSYSDGNGNTLNNGTINDPEGIAIDTTGNAWVASGGMNGTTFTTLDATNVLIQNSYYSDSTLLYQINSAGTSSTPWNGSGYGLKNSTGVAIDGNGLIFVSCPGITWNSKTQQGLGNPTTSTSGDLAIFNSGTSNFVTGANGITGTYVNSSAATVAPMTKPYFLAVDNAGNLWVNTNTTVVEYMGIATPVLTPLAANLLAHPTARRP